MQKICNLQKNSSRSYITPNATKERLMTEYQRAYRYIAGKILDFYLIHTIEWASGISMVSKWLSGIYHLKDELPA